MPFPYDKRRWYGWPVSRASATESPTPGIQHVPLTSSPSTTTELSSAKRICKPALPGSISRRLVLSDQQTGSGTISASLLPDSLVGHRVTVCPPQSHSCARFDQKPTAAPARMIAQPVIRAGITTVGTTANTASWSVDSATRGATY